MRWTSCAGRARGGCALTGSGVDAGYGKEPAFLRALGRRRASCSSPTSIAPSGFGPSGPSSQFPASAGPRASGEEAAGRAAPGHGGESGQGLRAGRLDALRPARRHARTVAGRHRAPAVFVWDGEESEARCWHLIVRREVRSAKTIKYSLSNAAADTPLLRLAQMQGHRYWVERAFEDAKGEVRPRRLSGAGLAVLASSRHDGDAGDAVHRRAARGPSTPAWSC